VGDVPARFGKPRNDLEHGRAYHGMEEIPKDLQETMRKRIR